MIPMTENNSSIRIVDYDSVSDPLVEAFRMLRLQIQTSIDSNDLDSTGKTILITSSVEKEGKTTISCNLAQMCAIARIPTLLIDTDLRKPKVHEAFGIERKPGITDTLLSDRNISPPIVKTLVPNLSILPAGKTTKHTTEILGSPPFSMMLNELKKQYSLIIMDSPPAGIVSDVGVLANKVDSIFLVIRVGVTKIRTIKQVVRTLKDLGGDLRGSILSRINPKRERYYYYHHYPRYYSTYYHDREIEKRDAD